MFILNYFVIVVVYVFNQNAICVDYFIILILWCKVCWFFYNIIIDLEYNDTTYAFKCNILLDASAFNLSFDANCR